MDFEEAMGVKRQETSKGSKERMGAHKSMSFEMIGLLCFQASLFVQIGRAHV